MWELPLLLPQVHSLSYSHQSTACLPVHSDDDAALMQAAATAKQEGLQLGAPGTPRKLATVRRAASVGVQAACLAPDGTCVAWAEGSSVHLLQLVASPGGRQAMRGASTSAEAYIVQC